MPENFTHLTIKSHDNQTNLKYLLAAIISLALIVLVMFLDASAAIKIILILYIGLLPLFLIKPVSFLYYLFLFTPVLREISAADSILSFNYNVINYNAIINFSLISFGAFLLWRERHNLPAKLKNHYFTLPWLAFLLLAAASLLYSGDRGKALEEMIRLTGIFMILISSLLLVKNKITLKNLTAAMVIGAVIPGIIGVWQYFAGAGWYDATIGQNRIDSTFLHPANFAIYLLAALPIACSLLIWQMKKPAKLVIVSVVLMFFLLIIATLTRGAWLALLVMIIAYGLLKNKKMLVIGLAAVMLVYVLSPAVSQRVNDVFNPKYNSSLVTRINILTRNLPAFNAAPVLGHGFGSFEQVNLKYNQEARYYESLQAHNDYLRIIIELGLTGLILYLGIFLFLFKNILKYYRATADKNTKNYLYGLIILWLGILVISAGDNLLRIMPAQYLIWSYTGAVLAYARLNKKIEAVYTTTAS